MNKEKYKISIYPELICLCEVSEVEELDLYISNDNLTKIQTSILNLLEVIIMKQKVRHLFGKKEMKPIVSYNPNTMNEKQYNITIKKALKFLGVLNEINNTRKPVYN